MFDLSQTEFRLSDFAKTAGDEAPTPILSNDGAPSREVMDYCDKHNLTLDWALLGESPVHRRPKAPKLSDVEVDAIFLHGLLQGLSLLIDETERVSSPASNATTALVEEVIKKSALLSEDLGRLVDVTPGARSVSSEAIQ
ncbi:hypothetical protein JQX09_24565 [Sulfitobacter pseudonitzschiae]|uniref:Uncharacterized protein n=1 Tax=Pseudosulfitobacter pseudonitzschiae TaxID=1402135 RepID=A0A9Q2NNH4_9RHOB|nr:hypothetical protein [Pseudosulfitobacter pseudonitzschiae]MBM2295093.1 hypothetical protein [Pseudosulfitobacter pseudonitzschiae]MBM2300030.1 hypothetical protein [Pseudosulfitobacter pseudonitzschiae]MBM2304931.1 hypothetical protein [Pseudosulfitobacter pseudonitzschiae]MBM2314704.1 hypothetical protein [Pseudosulfitobacter pseudonitzschiae]MBM2319612.1 hypothetical protein [Pseudosulfitobacter pseudonitzschiae]